MFGRYEVRSTFNLWSTMLAETRRMAKDRANLAETMAAELVARLDIMAKDVMLMSRKVSMRERQRKLDSRNN